jgi:hypothetical protein
MNKPQSHFILLFAEGWLLAGAKFSLLLVNEVIFEEVSSATMPDWGKLSKGTCCMNERSFYVKKK